MRREIISSDCIAPHPLKPVMPAVDVDRNLLFGVIALRDDLIDQS
jgi:hypothetical protein